MSDRQHHIQCREGDVARYVLLPGDPARATRIAGFFDVAEKVAEHREYVTYTGEVGGTPITVTSTGIGCPSTAIAVEELYRIGADTFIRVGTAGGMQEAVLPGDQVIATGAIRDEGTTLHYMPVEFPAVADVQVVEALVEAARSQELRHHMGIMHTKDSFYGQHEPERMPIAQQLLERWDAWRAAGALCSEMEAAAIFVVSSVLGARAGAVCLAAGNQLIGERLEGEARERGVEETIECAIEAVRFLHQADQGG